MTQVYDQLQLQIKVCLTDSACWFLQQIYCEKNKKPKEVKIREAQRSHPAVQRDYQATKHEQISPRRCC
jgi:hypothetical protein